MKKNRLRFYLTEAELSTILYSLVELKNELHREGKYTDFVDDVILKVFMAQRKSQSY